MWTERDKAQIAEVFGLTGGELEDKPWITEREADNDFVCNFWYESFPEWAESDFEFWGEYRTVVRDIMFGAPPDRLGEWTKVATYMNSGECECFGRQITPNIVTPEQTATAGNECYYCSEAVGKPHGYIYLGDGWAEIVYKRDETETETEED